MLVTLVVHIRESFPDRLFGSLPSLPSARLNTVAPRVVVLRPGCRVMWHFSGGKGTDAGSVKRLSASISGPVNIVIQCGASTAAHWGFSVRGDDFEWVQGGVDTSGTLSVIVHPLDWYGGRLAARIRT
jgi:hypothetical protein